MNETEQRLVVTGRAAGAEDVLLLELAAADGTELPPATPGAHLELVLPSGLIRHYSLCGDLTDRRRYTVAVLRIEDGRGGSRELHETVPVGTEMTVRGPRNNFELMPADDYLFLAGGIGITPILSMVRVAQAEGRCWQLIYCGRSRSAMAFQPELERLGSDRVEIVPEDEAGRPDFELAIKNAPTGTAVYACGPPGMLRAIEDIVGSQREKVELHLERFAADGAATLRETAPDTMFEIRLARTGVVLQVPPDRSILDVVLEVLPAQPFSCSEGICGSCETTVLEGTPDHRDQVLTDFERSANESMMICVGRSLTPCLVLDL